MQKSLSALRMTGFFYWFNAMSRWCELLIHQLKRKRVQTMAGLCQCLDDAEVLQAF